METMWVAGEEFFLTGPDAAQTAELARQGWDPKLAEKIAAAQAQTENDRAALWDSPKVRRRLETLVAVCEWVEGTEFVAEVLREHGLRHEDIDPAEALRMLSVMPTMAVTLGLKFRNHWIRRPWKSNDIFDINTLSVAVPYADIVVADRYYADALRTTGLDDRLGTTVLSSLSALASHLKAL
ncbi:hypothetical protein [Kitasatospora sp. NPDC057015]|uniref:hypothetical protein n=1 Tax=Kitasatospora sp. NPDC057015 TaxID=3346001 RepID=UPI00363B9757